MGEIIKKKQSYRAKKIKSTGLHAWGVLRFLLLFGMSFLIIKPFVTKITMAFMLPADLLDATVNQIPKHLSTYYWNVALEGMNLSKTLINSISLTLLVSITQLSVSALVGYSLSRFKFKGRNFLYAMVIIFMLVPSSTYSIAQYLQFRYPLGMNLSLIDTLLPLFVLSLGGLGFKQGLYIYLFMTFFRGLPKNIEDAAMVDGAGSFKTFWSIMLPNSKSILITVSIFAFSWQWTDINYAKNFFPNMNIIASQISQIYIRVGLTEDPIGSAIAKNAACIILILPLLVLFVLGQRHLTQSISRTGMAN